jgi:uncharacterized protein
MNLFFDTSALIKKYIIEDGSDMVEELLNKADTVYISAITKIETFSTLKRLLTEKAIDHEDYKILKEEFLQDFQYFSINNLNRKIIQIAKEMIEKYQLKSLDSIQMGSVIDIKSKVDYFIVCDRKLINAGNNESLKIITPSE